MNFFIKAAAIAAVGGLVLSQVLKKKPKPGTTPLPHEPDMVDLFSFDPGQWETKVPFGKFVRVEVPSDFLQPGEGYAWHTEGDLLQLVHHNVGGIDVIDIHPVDAISGEDIVYVDIYDNETDENLFSMQLNVKLT